MMWARRILMGSGLALASLAMSSGCGRCRRLWIDVRGQLQRHPHHCRNLEHADRAGNGEFHRDCGAGHGGGNVDHRPDRAAFPSPERTSRRWPSSVWVRFWSGGSCSVAVVVPPT